MAVDMLSKPARIYLRTNHEEIGFPIGEPNSKTVTTRGCMDEAICLIPSVYSTIPIIESFMSKETENKKNRQKKINFENVAYFCTEA